jgi:hypothetical protein
MKRNRSSFLTDPGPPMELTKQKNYQQAFELACASLRKMDIEERGREAGAQVRKEDEKGMITLPFFSDPYEIVFPEMNFHCAAQRTISLVVRVLLLHYLIRADGSPLTGKWVGYKDIPGGLLYAGVFARRVTDRLVKRFGCAAKKFQEVGSRLGGGPAGVGDASFTLGALPFVPLQYVLWEGDEEFPASLQLLFDASVVHYLSLEDMVVLGQMSTGRLLRQSQG